MAQKELDSRNYKAGQNQSMPMPALGEIEDGDFMDQFQIIDRIDMKEVELAAFMEETVVVRVNKPHERNAPLGLMLCVQGRSQYIVKGLAQRIKRKYLECLARAQRQFIETPETYGSNGQPNGTKVTKTTSLEHDFAVLRDDNPKGHAWLEGILAEG